MNQYLLSAFLLKWFDSCGCAYNLSNTVLQKISMLLDGHTVPAGKITHVTIWQYCISIKQ